MPVSTPLAHAKWFVDPQSRFPVEWNRLASVDVVIPLALCLATVIAITVVVRSFQPPAMRSAARLGALAPKVPRILQVTLGLGLVGLTVAECVWVPSLHADDVTAGWVLAALQGALGVWLIAGVCLKGAAFGVLMLAGLVALLVDPLAVIEAAYIPAIAAALLLEATPGHGRDATRQAATTLRFGLGAGLIAVAFTEKLLVPGFTATVLETHSMLDVLQTLGLTNGPETFIRLAGCIEVALGALLITGALAPRVALGALVPFVGTLPLFGATELVGHLPIYGALLGIGILTCTEHARETVPAPVSFEPVRHLASVDLVSGLRRLGPAPQVKRSGARRRWP